MRTIIGWLLAIIFLISGCTFNVEVLTPGTPGPTPIPTQSVPSPIATITVEPFSPTHAPIELTPPALFYGAYVALDPVGSSAISFPEGTKQVYAIMNYQNMTQGMVVRREWYLDGTLWLMREEPWDFTKYGSSGTIRDISIYDWDYGLPNGVYQLRVFVDGVPQPIGVASTGQGQNWLDFEITSADRLISAKSSPDSKWSVYLYNSNRLVLRDSNGTSTELYTGLEIPYFTWFGDSKHVLFVDRDRSEQITRTTIGIRDQLWLVDIPSGIKRRLYDSDTSFTGTAGPMPSFEGNYIAAIEGSNFFDACFVDKRMIFFEIASDFNSATVIKQQDFPGVPVFDDSTVYPKEDGGWQSGNVFRVQMDGTCYADQTKMGTYLFNVPNRTASMQLTAGDLGWGAIHGKVTDAATGAPIANATVTCEQHSYTPSTPCSGSSTTSADGSYIFNTVYFHDTDTIKLTVQATGYQTKEVTQSFFTFNDWEANITLNR